ncbi:hypothetical protein [Rhizobium sp. AC27/96]|uniref:hypothetical protein n=1 Tax=Rhizobium sp. AC27/96 TaxID=1841653 RepID=UPI0011463E71|nr:hypothetical protein [Rhizobium sp. AC27/96]
MTSDENYFSAGGHGLQNSDSAVKYRFHRHGQSTVTKANGILRYAASQMRERDRFFSLSGLRMARPSFVHWKILRNVFIEIQND